MISSRSHETVWWSLEHVQCSCTGHFLISPVSEKLFFPYFYFSTEIQANQRECFVITFFLFWPSNYLVARIILCSHSSLGQRLHSSHIIDTIITCSTLLLAKHGISVDQVRLKNSLSNKVPLIEKNVDQVIHKSFFYHAVGIAKSCDQCVSLFCFPSHIKRNRNEW
jgi:hypothetical protein